MPVTPEEWESGAAYTPLTKGILSFLRENSPMGYSADEIFGLLPDIGRVHEFNGDNTQLSAIVKALDTLVVDEQLELKELETETAPEKYYRSVN